MPIGTAALLGIGASAAGGVAGQIASSGDRAKALQSNQQAIQEWLNANIPDPAQQKLLLQQYVQTGKLDPQVEQTIKQQQSEMSKVQADPSLKASQLRALSTLEDIGNQGGMDLDSKSAVLNAQNEINVADRGKREAIQDNFARRGIGGSGLDMAAQLQGAQASGDRLANAQMDAVTASRKRALDAILQGGNLAGNIRSQDFGEKKDSAAAQDTINAFNARNMQSVQDRNINRMNDAQKYNLDLQQGIANKNVDLANTQQQYNKELYQKQFDNQARKAGGLSGAYGNEANAYNANADRTAGQWASLGSGIQKGLTDGSNFAMMNDYLDRKYPQSEKTVSSAPKPVEMADRGDDMFDGDPRYKNRFPTYF